MDKGDSASARLNWLEKGLLLFVAYVFWSILGGVFKFGPYLVNGFYRKVGPFLAEGMIVLWAAIPVSMLLWIIFETRVLEVHAGLEHFDLGSFYRIRLDSCVQLGYSVKGATGWDRRRPFIHENVVQ